MSVKPVPSIEESATAVAKAVDARRAKQPDRTELIQGVTLDPPRGGRDGWWLVGRVLDERADAEFSVWYLPGPRRSVSMSKT